MDDRELMIDWYWIMNVVSSDAAIECLQTAVDLLIETAKYARAGTVLQWMAEIYEENNDMKMAGETYAQVKWGGTVLQWMAEIYEENNDMKMAGETSAQVKWGGTVLQWMAEIYEENNDVKMAGETYAQVRGDGETVLKAVANDWTDE